MYSRVGGAAEVQLLGDRDERPQVTQLDRVGSLREGEQMTTLIHAPKYGLRAVRR